MTTFFIAPAHLFDSETQETRGRPQHPQAAFGDRSDARLILELEKTLHDSPNFDLGRFRSSLEAKDAYGNDQVSRQHVVMAASGSHLNIRQEMGEGTIYSNTVRTDQFGFPARAP